MPVTSILRRLRLPLLAALGAALIGAGVGMAISGVVYHLTRSAMYSNLVYGATAFGGGLSIYYVLWWRRCRPSASDPLGVV